MNASADVDQKFRDLAFELEAGQGPKFLIIVCDDATKKSHLKKALDQHLSETGRRMIYIAGNEAGDDLINMLSNRFRVEHPGGISWWDLDALDSLAAKRLFAQLNFHRDWLTKLNVPILVWTTPDQLDELINWAPDFWSRRGAVYYFSKRSLDDLLTKLFAKAGDANHDWTPEPALSDAFETILSSERELSRSLRDKTSFSLQSVDGFIRNIRDGASRLIEECKKGREIEVALWLWNFSHLDSVLQNMLDNLEPGQRSMLESLYTDRNEVLLHLSQQLMRILENYLAGLEENIRSNKRVSLVSRASSFAISEINKMAMALTNSVELPLSSDIEEFEEFFSNQLEKHSREPQENAFLIQAADDFESWLSGQTNTRPPFFSREEGILLRMLYSKQSGAAAVAEGLGITLNKATEKIRFLERKVRLYLGLPPRLPPTRHGSRQRRSTV